MFIGEFDKVSYKLVDAVLVAGVVNEAVVLEGIEELAGEFVNEFGAILEAGLDFWIFLLD